MSERRVLRTRVYAAVEAAFARPRYRGADQLADEITAMIRDEQNDAWTRGYAAAQLDAYDAKHGRSLDRRSPYKGGRHAGAPARYGTMTDWDMETPANLYRHPRPEAAVHAMLRHDWAAGRWEAKSTPDTWGTIEYPQTNPNPEGK